MADPGQHLSEVGAGGFTPSIAAPGPGRTARCILSEFERAQVRRIAEEGAALAAAVVLWHREYSAMRRDDLDLRLSHGLGVAALGALIMQILSWTRLVEPLDVPADTLRSAREVIDSPDPEAEPAALDTRARGMLIHAMGIKAKARRISRLW
jgi:hypothetical protein